MFEFLLKKPKTKVQHSKLFSDLLEKRYQELVVRHHIQSDAAQIQILGHLQQLLDNVVEQFSQNKLSKLNRSKSNSLYIFGDVGRGKTLLMDVFYEACPIELKRRVHFHAFMQEVHEYIHQWRKQKKKKGDPLVSLAAKIRSESVLICFDEFHISDIADAMLLSRLFSQLIEQGIIFVATSNQHPDDLYKEGLQRELFLPFISLLKQSSEILELVAKEDYRLLHFQSMEAVFHVGIDEKGQNFLEQHFNELTNKGCKESKELKVKGRSITFSSVHGDILFSSFSELCDRDLGPADYLMIAMEFSTLLISGIPVFSKENKDQARRFVTLIDAIYEQNVKLICTLEQSLDVFCFKNKDFDMKRTWSRLYEMQSNKYFSM